MSEPSKPGHIRHATALIHGLSSAEVQTLADSCAEAKDRAYCKLTMLRSALPAPFKRGTRLQITDHLDATGPYSNFRVGCALLLGKGVVIQGANVENASYPVGICAERTALATAVVQGAKRGEIRALAVSTDLDVPASPCGMCRQFIREFCDVSWVRDGRNSSADSLQLQMPVMMYDKSGKSTVMTVEQLLPLSFGPEKLLSTDQITIGLTR